MLKSYFRQRWIAATPVRRFVEYPAVKDRTKSQENTDAFLYPNALYSFARKKIIEYSQKGKKKAAF